MMRNRDPEMDHMWHTTDGKPLPDEPHGLAGLKARRECRRLWGGHFWHPVDDSPLWACCQCGMRRHGAPSDGT